MTDTEPSNPGTWISKIIDGGLPQILAGPAGNAISRLLGAAVDIPAAYLHGIAQRENDKTEARTYISQQLSKRAAEIAVEDPRIMDRALNNMLSRSYRMQENKDAIVALAIEDLQADPPSDNSPGPSEDWIMRFERYAEDASSNDIRLMFSRLLTSEIRDPGTISPATLHFSSMLDAETAKLIERILSFLINEETAVIECLDPPLNVVQMAQLEQSGFLSGGKTYTVTSSEDGVMIMSPWRSKVGIAIKESGQFSVGMEAAILSRPGMELARIISKDFDYRRFAKFLENKEGVNHVYVGNIEFHDNGSVTMPNPLKSTSL